MTFWGNLVGYQVVWFAVVVGAGLGQPLPGVVAALAFVSWQSWGPQRALMLRLAGVAVVAGLIIDGALASSGLLVYASPGPSQGPSLQWPPPWILAIWAAFAVTLPRSLGFLQGRPWLATAFGAVGGPLAYLAAARMGAVAFPMPPWPALAALAVAWAVAMPLLATCASRFARMASPPALASGVPSQ